ncbi:E3 ubiquitin-protein ligase FANCL-like isoform X1 [Palaemon carinicauda]|uniref:E3 ubiquitin-protein ligase FANCL-like isoform X1 n=1 Tax=Palaemon carinicauda TaxID=392227 RepID=UPI0035B5D256
MAVAAFCAEFPWLLPSLDTKPPRSFHGLIDISNTCYEISLKVPKFPSAKGLRLSSGVSLSCLIERCRCQLSKIEQESYTALEYLRKFQEICNLACSKQDASREVPLPTESFFTSILSNLEAIGWSKVCEISPDFTYVTLQERDVKGRLHNIKVGIPPGYPEEEPVVEANLPREFIFSWNSVEGLHSIFAAFKEQLSSLQQFWDILDDLDEMAVVLDPQNPERRHKTRRIFLSNHVSVQLTISVDHPRNLPQFHLFGPSSLTTPLNARLTEKYQVLYIIIIADWDPEQSIVSNIERVLEVEVVKRSMEPDDGNAEWGTECAVCYSLHLEGCHPDFTCDHCSQSFHLQCLYEWLHGLPNSRQSMNFIFGDCPYCSMLISCKVPE